MEKTNPITLNALDAVKFKLPEAEKKDWRPADLVQADRIVRIQSMQTRILQTIKADPLPPDECVAALGGCVIWLLGMNLPTLTLCLSAIRNLKDQLKAGMEKQWPTCSKIREELLRRITGEPQQIPAETDSADGGSSSEAPPNSIPGSEIPDAKDQGKIPDRGGDGSQDR